MENASGKHGARLWDQEDVLRQDAEFDGTMHHGEGFCNLASGASEAPDVKLRVADDSTSHSSFTTIYCCMVNE